MNFYVKAKEFELVLEQADAGRTEKAILGSFAYLGIQLEGIEVEEKPTNSKSTFTEPINGIRKINGQNMYQTAYRCSACNDVGRRYVHAKAKTTKCHKCKTELDVVRAVDSEDLQCDDEFNYFVAY